MKCTIPALTLLVLLGPSALAADAEHPNVLFIAVDDRKPLLNCQGHALGIRTDRYHYIGWYRYQWQSSGSLRVQGKPVASELYDYVADPNETENLAGKPEYRNTDSELAKFLQSHVDYSQSQQL